jgi:hypothetical protein
MTSQQSSNIMARTTVDIDVSVLGELKARAKAEHKSLGRLISELVPLALEQGATTRPAAELHWRSQPMGALVDLDDKEAVAALLDRQP